MAKYNLNGQEVDIKFKFRSEILFEEVNGKSFTGETISDWLLYFYCTVIANTSDDFIKYDEFVEWLDENPDLLFEFIQWYTEYQSGIIEKRKTKIEADLKKKVKKTTKKKG